MGVAITTLALGPLQANCTILSDTENRDCWIVDPGMRPEPAIERIGSEDLRLRKILLTHGHCDHAAGVGTVKQAFPDAVICCPEKDAEMLGDSDANLSAAFGVPMTFPPADELLQVGQELTLGDTVWKVLDTSGHTPGGVSFYCPDLQVVIAGDALFARSIGRTDFPGSSHAQLITTIRENLLTLPDETQVITGHGPQTTIGLERAANPFLQ